MDSRQSARSVLYGRSSAAKHNLLHRDKIREGRFPLSADGQELEPVWPSAICQWEKFTRRQYLVPCISAAKERERRTDLQEGRKEKRCPMIVS